MGEPLRRHPGLSWLALGCAFGALAAFTSAGRDAERCRRAGDGVGYLAMGVLLSGSASLAMIVTGTILGEGVRSASILEPAALTALTPRA